MIFSIFSTTASCTLILRDLSEMRYSWSQGQIWKVKVTMRIKQKVMFRLYNFLWASWIAVIVRMLFVYNQWVCNVMTLTQSESRGAHVHYIVSRLYLFPGNLNLCDTRIYPDSAVLFFPYLPHVSWCLKCEGFPFQVIFWRVFEVSSDFAIFVAPANQSAIEGSSCPLSVCPFVCLPVCLSHFAFAGTRCVLRNIAVLVDLSDFKTFSSPVVHYGAILWCGLAEIWK